MPEEEYPSGEDAPEYGTPPDAAYQNIEEADPYAEENPYEDGQYDDEDPYADPYAETPDGEYNRDDRDDTRRRLLQQALPEACGALPELTTWESGAVYEITAFVPAASQQQNGAQQFLAATRPLGGTNVLGRIAGAPGDVPANFRDTTAYDPLRVCSWKHVLCGPDGPLQVMLIDGGGALPPELLSDVPSLRGVAVYGGQTQGEPGDRLPDIPPDSQVWCCWLLAWQHCLRIRTGHVEECCAPAVPPQWM